MKNPPLNSIMFLMLMAMTQMVSAQAVTLTADDPAGKSSFTSGVRWSDGLAPSAGKDYVVDGTNSSSDAMRSPGSSSSSGSPYIQTATFAGDSLTLQNGGLLSLKGSNYNNRVVIDNLILDNGTVAANQPNTVPLFEGNIHLLSGGGIIDLDNGDRGIALKSVVTGTGALSLVTGTGGRPISFESVSANTYSGGTYITGSRSSNYLNVKNDGIFGTGDVFLDSTVLISIGSGTTHDYINDSAMLSFDGGTSSIFLDFAGTDTIGALSFDGGSTFAAVGTWGATGSGAANIDDTRFSGTGVLNVIPEPSSVMLVAIAAFSFGILKIRKRRN
ncbi:PEP-CTERM sorting domain-containing protein [Kiritimatiellaeota bacterium B1221]|nr:PEP-CTERM sorting domain-containing protein [Kiritimatiellaeota bacterium B1221]